MPRECVDNSNQDSVFRCTSLGYFPNINNCSSYFFCGMNEAGTGFEFTAISCPNGNVFDPNAAGRCSRENIFNKCVGFECRSDITTLTYGQITYGQNRQYFALCVPNADPKNPRIFACPSNTQPNLSVFPATCDYRCPRTGSFENSLDRTKYFLCYLNNQLRLVSEERSCPPRSEFNTSRSQCESISRALNEDESV